MIDNIKNEINCNIDRTFMEIKKPNLNNYFYRNDVHNIHRIYRIKNIDNMYNERSKN